MRLPSLIRLVVFIVIGAVPVAGQVQAQRLNIDAFLQQWDTDHDGTLSVDEIKKAALAPALLCFIVALSASPFKSKSRLEAENAALRHQLMVLRRKVHGRVGLTNNDRLFSYSLAMPEAVEQWSLTSLKEKLIKIGAKVVSHGRYVVFQLAEVAASLQSLAPRAEKAHSDDRH